MQRFELIEVDGRVTECLGASLYKVLLPNSHEVVARVSDGLVSVVDGNFGVAANKMLIGHKVLLSLRAFDLSAGSIVALLEPSAESVPF
jgi:translation initiation factor IF-1